MSVPPVSSSASSSAMSASDRLKSKICEFSWILEDNTAMRRPIELGGAQVDKIHRVYEKQLVTRTARADGPATGSAAGQSDTLARGLV